MKPSGEKLPEEVTKQSIRKKVWDYLEANNLAHYPRPVHGRIPNFKGAAEAAHKIAELDVFRSAMTIKVNPDKPQEPVRYLALEMRKTLLVPIPRLRSGLFQQIVVPSGTSKQDIKVAASQRGSIEWGKPLGLDAKVSVDLIVLGSVAVSEEGYRIGKGEGFADLEFGMMMKMGAVNQETLVATTVHDCQVFKTLPTELFKEHDVPVDIIITPTRVINVNPRLPKPQGIIWGLLTPRRISEMPILKILREAEQGEGKDCKLKSCDSDEEGLKDDGQRNRQNRYRTSHLQSSKSENDGYVPYTETQASPQRSRTFRRNRVKSSGDNLEEATTETKEVQDTVKRERQRNFHARPAFEFSLRVQNIGSDVRVRDLKAALAERGVKPTDITWRGHRGFAYLHFTKSGSEFSGVPESVDKIVASLQDLKIGSGECLKIEPAKPVTRIEVTDISSV